MPYFDNPPMQGDIIFMAQRLTAELEPWYLEAGAAADLLAAARGLPSRYTPQAAVVAQARAEASRAASRGGVAVIPILGPIDHRAGWIDWLGGTSLQRLEKELVQAAGDEAVERIVLDIDSPGGSSAGMPDAAELVRQVAGEKTVTAVANVWCASAAYYLASQASEVVVDASGHIGSIGSLIIHAEFSEALANGGWKVTLVRKPEQKGRGGPFEPLDDATRERFERVVGNSEDLFARAVARGRNVKLGEVRSEAWGRGEMLLAKEAVAVGMADRIGNLEGVLAGTRRRGSMRNLRNAQRRLKLQQPSSAQS